ncbi:MAG: hypothetical protein J7604_23050 [Sporocytophaga sp.]|uniref:hypothetical protein n=1 Tax=Sporocytophaga sp. TaxID=2231183 RepID=UPI001B0ABBF8|nr:hypothetical protein [Sporocytophaga sp.]MBO9703110.1 hypothetical protein [Sporocytophaga sp.]
MNFLKSISFLTAFLILTACSSEKLEEKGFSVASQESSTTEETNVDGFSKDSLHIETRPSNVLLTGIPKYRISTIYKVNYKDDQASFIGNNEFYGNDKEIGRSNGNQWNYNFMPGLQAVHGYNLVNISHYNTETQTQKNFFEKPVLIKTFYYPSFSKDTLNHKPVNRNYYLISVYNEDTNKDGSINLKDLRRLYYFDIDALNKKPLIPVNYSVVKSEYDPANDYMYVFAKIDANKNGISEDKEAIHIFWIDLNAPERNGRQY